MMGVFENLARAAGFAQSSGGAGHVLLWEQLKPWLAQISQNGAVKWLPRTLAQNPCQVPRFEGGRPAGSCEHLGVDLCISCRKSTCLDHAFVDSNADLICYMCVANRAANAPYTPPNQEAPPPPPGDPRKQRAEQRAAWARGVLGVAEGAGWEEVKRAHRGLSGRWHPDRSDGDEARYKDVQIAYDVLKTIYGEN